MSSMINLKASRKTPSITISANPVTNVHVTNRGEGSSGPTMGSSGQGSSSPFHVQYPPVLGDGALRQSPVDMGVPNGEFVSVSPQTAMSTFTATPIVDENPEIARLMRENAVLKLIIDIQHNNPLIVNKYIVADDETLMKMVALLCNATEVNIDADDLGRGCLTKNIYRKVHSIYVTVDGQTKNLKYDFSDVMKTLKDLHISVKYVF